MENRRHYRVSHPEVRLSVSILTPTGTVNTDIVDVSSGGLALRVSNRGVFAVGDELRLSIASIDQPVEFEMRTVVRHEKSGGEDQILGLEFGEPERLEKYLPPRIFAVFNRRRAFRVRPNASDHIVVQVRRAESQVTSELKLIDISSGGLGGVGAVCEVGHGFEVDQVATMSFTLPGTMGEFEIDGIVRAVVALPDNQCRVGLSFDTNSRQFARHEEALMSYVMRRQHEQMRLAS